MIVIFVGKKTLDRQMSDKYPAFNGQLSDFHKSGTFRGFEFEIDTNQLHLIGENWGGIWMLRVHRALRVKYRIVVV